MNILLVYVLFADDGTGLYGYDLDFDAFNPQTEEQQTAVQAIKDSFGWKELPAYLFRQVTQEEADILFAPENQPGEKNRMVYDLENGGLRRDDETLRERLENQTLDYEAEVAQLQSAMVTALLNNDDETVAELKEEYKQLMAEYNTALENA